MGEVKGTNELEVAVTRVSPEVESVSSSTKGVRGNEDQKAGLKEAFRPVLIVRRSRLLGLVPVITSESSIQRRFQDTKAKATEDRRTTIGRNIGNSETYELNHTVGMDIFIVEGPDTGTKVPMLNTACHGTRIKLVVPRSTRNEHQI